MTETVAEPHADDLPEGWAEVHISDIADVNPRKKKEDRLDNGTPVSFVPMAAVDADVGAITEPEERTYGAVKKGYTHFRDDDVIFARITPCMENGKAAVARGLINSVGFGSTEFHVIRPTAAVLPEYVYHFVRQGTYRHDAAAHMTGAVGQARVPADYVKETGLPLAPLTEQARVVAAAEALLARMRDVRDRLDRVPAILRRFRQSVLAAACDGRLTEDWRAAHPEVESADALLERIEEERRTRLGKKYKTPAEPDTDKVDDVPEGWEVTTLDALAVHITSGSRGWAKYYADEGGTFIRAQNINSDQLDLSDVALVDAPSGAEADRTRVEFGDLLVTITGANVTKAGWVDRAIEEGYISQHVSLVRPVDPAMARFLHLWTVCPTQGRDQLSDASYGAGKPGLNLTNIRELVVAVPSAEEQEEIIRRADALLVLADQVEARVGAARRHAERTAQAILAKAFRGELVPTEAELARAEGRDYETAEALLERVKAEEEARKAAPKRKAPTTTVQAPDLFSQPPAVPVNGNVPRALREAAEAGIRTTPRELLSWFGQKRRGSAVVERVRSALDTLGAETQPDFAKVGLDDEILVTRS